MNPGFNGGGLDPQVTLYGTCRPHQHQHASVLRHGLPQRAGDGLGHQLAHSSLGTQLYLVRGRHELRRDQRQHAVRLGRQQSEYDGSLDHLPAASRAFVEVVPGRHRHRQRRQRVAAESVDFPDQQSLRHLYDGGQRVQRQQAVRLRGEAQSAGVFYRYQWWQQRDVIEPGRSALCTAAAIADSI